MKPSVPRLASLMLVFSPLLPACGENSLPPSPAEESSGDSKADSSRVDSNSIVSSDPVAIPRPQSSPSHDIAGEFQSFGSKLSALIQSAPSSDKTFKDNLIKLEIEWTRLESLVVGHPTGREKSESTANTVERSLPEAMTAPKFESDPALPTITIKPSKAAGSVTVRESVIPPPSATPKAAVSATSPDRAKISKVTDLKIPPSGFESRLEFVEPLLSIKMVWNEEAGCWISSEPTSSLNLRDGAMINTFCRQLDLGTQGTFFPADWVFQAMPNGFLRVVPESVPREDLAPLLMDDPTTAKPLDFSTKSGFQAATKESTSETAGIGSRSGESHPDLAASTTQSTLGLNPSTAAPIEQAAAHRPQPTSPDSIPATIQLSQPEPTEVSLPGTSAPLSGSGETKSNPESTNSSTDRTEIFGVATSIKHTFTSGPSERKWIFHFDPSQKVWRTRDAPLAGEVKEQHRSSVCENWTLTARENGLLPGWSFVPEIDGNVAILNKVPPTSEYRPPTLSAARSSSSGRFVSGTNGTPINAGAFKSGADTLPDGTLPSTKNSDAPKQGPFGKTIRAVGNFISKPLLEKSEKGIE